MVKTDEMKKSFFFFFSHRNIWRRVFHKAAEPFRWQYYDIYVQCAHTMPMLAMFALSSRARHHDGFNSIRERESKKCQSWSRLTSMRCKFGDARLRKGNTSTAICWSRRHIRRIVRDVQLNNLYEFLCWLNQRGPVNGTQSSTVQLSRRIAWIDWRLSLKWRGLSDYFSSTNSIGPSASVLRIILKLCKICVRIATITFVRWDEFHAFALAHRHQIELCQSGWSRQRWRNGMYAHCAQAASILETDT